MNLNLSNYQFKLDHYKSKLFYVNLMIKTKQKPIVDRHIKEKRKESKHTTTEKYQVIKGESKRRAEKHKEIIKQPKSICEIATGSQHLTMITLEMDYIANQKTVWLNG